MLKVSKGYLVGVDISESDEAVVQVVEAEGLKRKLVKTFTGDDALYIYEVLTGQKEIDKTK